VIAEPPLKPNQPNHNAIGQVMWSQNLPASTYTATLSLATSGNGLVYVAVVSVIPDGSTSTVLALKVSTGDIVFTESIPCDKAVQPMVGSGSSLYVVTGQNSCQFGLGSIVKLS
jgi:outer membrane protein assembly factor BamB